MEKDRGGGYQQRTGIKRWMARGRNEVKTTGGTGWLVWAEENEVGARWSDAKEPKAGWAWSNARRAGLHVGDKVWKGGRNWFEMGRRKGREARSDGICVWAAKVRIQLSQLR